MKADEAWEKITQITNKERMTERDIKTVRALMKFMPEREQAWIEEALFLEEKARKRG
jgi:hypothetical protein